MKNSIVNRIIKICPNWPIAKKALSSMRVKMISSHYISSKEVKAGESDPALKKELVEKYKSKKARELKETINVMTYVLDNAPKYKEIQNRSEIEADMIFCRLAYGFQPDEYLCFGLDGQSQEERQTWISDLDRYLYIHSMNDVKDSQIFNNKARTYDLFGKYYGRAAISIEKESDFSKFKNFLETYSEFVKKQVHEGMGRSIELVKADSISPRQYFDSLVANGEYIIEERIKQSSVMSTLNTSSVNTVRCITVNTRDGVVVPYTFLKVGRNGSFVDNGGAGGILAGIDVNSGVIMTNGYDEFSTEYIKHPDSGVEFIGYVFPHWKEMKSMCCEMAGAIPSVKCIGWDVTLTDKGWIVVEGNGMTQFIGPQIVFKRGIKQEVLDLMKNVDLIVRTGRSWL